MRWSFHHPCQIQWRTGTWLFNGGLLLIFTEKHHLRTEIWGRLRNCFQNQIQNYQLKVHHWYWNKPWYHNNLANSFNFLMLLITYSQMLHLDFFFSTLIFPVLNIIISLWFTVTSVVFVYYYFEISFILNVNVRNSELMVSTFPLIKQSRLNTDQGCYMYVLKQATHSQKFCLYWSMQKYKLVLVTWQNSLRGHGGDWQ